MRAFRKSQRLQQEATMVDNQACAPLLSAHAFYPSLIKGAPPELIAVSENAIRRVLGQHGLSAFAMPDVPTPLRKYVVELSKQLRRKVVQAASDPFAREFKHLNKPMREATHERQPGNHTAAGSRAALQLPQLPHSPSPPPGPSATAR
jgi:hypothetical protein